MKGIVQSRTGENGTCFRACLATILGLKEADVPDFPQANQDPGVNRFLRSFGLRYEQIPVSEPAPRGLHTIEGTSPRGGEHAVVGRGGKMIWDPHPQDSTGRGLIKKKTWGVLMPIDQEVKPVGDAHEFVVKETPKGWVVFEDGLRGYPFPTKEKAVKHAEGTAAIRTVNGQRPPVRVEGKDSVLRPKDIKRGPGAFTVQLTDPDGREHTEPVSSLRTYDSVDPKREARIRALGKIEPHQYQTPKPGSASLPCKQCGLSVWAAEHKVKATDGLLSNTAMLLAVLYAWYRSRMDEPAQQPRNWDLTTYVPRQRAFDGMLNWKGSPAPTGKYCSFEKRSWPGADYSDGSPAAALYGDKPYSKVNGEGGSVIRVCVADWSVGKTEEGRRKSGAFVWRTLSQRASSLKEAKSMAESFLSRHPEYHK
jgi:hypothetical protein